MSDNEIKRPSCCAECAKYFRDDKQPGHGWCDNWAGVQIHDYDVCRPNMGVKKEGSRE